MMGKLIKKWDFFDFFTILRKMDDEFIEFQDYVEDFFNIEPQYDTGE